MDLQPMIDAAMKKAEAEIFAKGREDFKRTYREARPSLVEMGTTLSERLAMGTMALDYLEGPESSKMVMKALMQSWIMDVENEATLEANNDHA